MDDLLFCMEDQNTIFLLDTENAYLMNVDDIDVEDERYVPIPEWKSSDGFRLMERFAAGFRNPLVQDALHESLEQGRGVFRAFKQSVSRFPQAEKQWFDFKKREMRRHIIAWYNALREDWNMEKIGEEPEEFEDIFFDFMFRPYSPADFEAAAVLHEKCDFNSHGDLSNIGEIVLIAETASRDFVGFAAVKRKSQDGENLLYISALEVSPEYRGMGIGSELCSCLLKQAVQEGADKIFIDLPAESEGFSRFLHRCSFKPSITRFVFSAARDVD